MDEDKTDADTEVQADEDRLTAAVIALASE